MTQKLCVSAMAVTLNLKNQINKMTLCLSIFKRNKEKEKEKNNYQHRILIFKQVMSKKDKTEFRYFF